MSNYHAEPDIRRHRRGAFPIAGTLSSTVWHFWPLRAIAFTLVVAVVSPLALERTWLHAQESPRGSQAKRFARSVHVLIETSQSAYRIGEPIGVRVSLVNTSDQRIAFFSSGTQYDVDLIVAGSDGQRVKATGHKVPPAASSGAPAVLLAGQTVPWGWREGDWMYLSEWGYELREPGTYTIRGLPRLGFPGLEPDNRTVRSNAVTITLTP